MTSEFPGNLDSVKDIKDLNTYFFHLRNMVKGEETLTLTDTETETPIGKTKLTGDYTIDGYVHPTGNLTLKFTNPLRYCTYTIYITYENLLTGETHIEDYTTTNTNNSNITLTIPLTDLGENEAIQLEYTTQILFNIPQITLVESGLLATTTTIASSSSSVLVGSTVTLSGTLVDNESTGMVGKSVKIYQGNTLLTTLTTTSGGAFTYTTSALSVGSYSFKAVFDGDSSYYGSQASVSVTVTSLIVPTISLSASSSIISVGDTPSLTGSLLDNGTGITGASVKIYQGTSLLDTVTTDSNGAFSYTGSATTSSGSLTYKAVFDGDSSYASVTSSDVIVTVSKVNTSLDIDVPLSLVYSDAFNITGTLTDASNNAIGSATVKLKVDGSVVDTGTTNSSGVVQFTRTPVTMGNHTFTLTYEGTAKYNSVDSQTVSRTIGKETSVITVTSPSNNSSWYSDGSVTVTGTLLTDDGESMASKSVVVSESGTTITTFTTDSNGAFSGSLTGLSTGSHSLKFEFVTDDYYATSNVTRAVTIASPTLSVTGTKSIVSYADSETSVITATYTGAVLSGHSVVFKNGSTTLDTVSTDNNGQASYTYTSSGAGDVSISVECNLLQETFVIEDCWYYNATEYGPDGAGNMSSVQLNQNLPSVPFTFEYMVKQTNTNYSVPYLDIGDSSSNRMLIGQYARAGTNGLIVYKSSSTTHAYSTNPTINEYNTIWFKADGTKYYYKLNNGSVMEVNDANVTLSKIIHIESGRGGYVKNIKVKAL